MRDPHLPDDQPGTLDRVLTLPARVGGTALALAVRGLSSVRGTRKPLHPRGEYWTATLTRDGARGPATGVGWLDDPGAEEVTVRLSRAVGLPKGWPDFQGIAVRLGTGDCHADLLFATTGLGRLSRFVLTPATGSDQRPYTTLLPYRGPNGPLLLGIRPRSRTTYELLQAGGTGEWTRFGTLELHRPYDGPMISFDPMLAPVPGMPPYAWVRALRLPAYRAARLRLPRSS